MSGYSGRVSFSIEVERYVDKSTGEILLPKNVNFSNEDFDFEYDIETIELEVTGNSYYTPGRYSGLPEDCYPDESETEIESVYDVNGKDWRDNLTSDEENMIIELIAEKVSNGDCGSYSEPDDYPDYDYDYDFY